MRECGYRHKYMLHKTLHKTRKKNLKFLKTFILLNVHSYWSEVYGSAGKYLKTENLSRDDPDDIISDNPGVFINVISTWLWIHIESSNCGWAVEFDIHGQRKSVESCRVALWEITDPAYLDSLEDIVRLKVSL